MTPAVSYESDLLDARFLDMARAYGKAGDVPSDADFDALALDIYAYQLAHNTPYRRYVGSLGAGIVPRSWREIPAVPASAFKDATLATFDPLRSELVFHTSGTTTESTGKHFVERAALYDASLLAGFDRFMLADGARLRYLSVVPNPRQKPHSSLGYMMGHVGVLRGDGKAAYFLSDDSQTGDVAIDTAGFGKALDLAIAAGQPVCIAGTAFGLVALIDALDSAGRTFVAPPGSRIMETGGFKGRVRVVERPELYAALTRTLGIAARDIVAEYGMTELLSQFYDSHESRDSDVRVKAAPPWLRTMILDARGHEVPDGETGYLRHIDLANRSSVLAIDTEDRGYRVPGGIVLLGREIDAPARGCSLDAESLLDARR